MHYLGWPCPQKVRVWESSCVESASDWESQPASGARSKIADWRKSSPPLRFREKVLMQLPNDGSRIAPRPVYGACVCFLLLLYKYNNLSCGIFLFSPIPSLCWGYLKGLLFPKYWRQISLLLLITMLVAVTSKVESKKVNTQLLGHCPADLGRDSHCPLRRRSFLSHPP